MHRIDTPTADPTANGVGKAGFRAGAPPGVASTRLDSAWFNGAQETLAAPIEAAGIALVKGDNAQLLAAIERLARRPVELANLLNWRDLDRNTLPGSETRRSVACSPTTIVVVSNGGNVTWSFLGNTFADAGSGSGYVGNINDVCWFGLVSLFVFCGGGDEIQTSPLGDVWTERSTGGADLHACAASAAIVVVVGDAGVIKTSPDAVAWNTRTSAHGAVDINGLAYSPTLNRFVAVGDGATVQRSSTSGSTWTAAADVAIMTGSPDLVGVIWSDLHALFFAWSADRVFKSADGVTWSAATGSQAVSGRTIASVVALPEHLVLSYSGSPPRFHALRVAELDGTPVNVVQLSLIGETDQSVGEFLRLVRIPASSGFGFAGRVIGVGTGSIMRVLPYLG